MEGQQVFRGRMHHSGSVSSSTPVSASDSWSPQSPSVSQGCESGCDSDWSKPSSACCLWNEHWRLSFHLSAQHLFKGCQRSRRAEDTDSFPKGEAGPAPSLPSPLLPPLPLTPLLLLLLLFFSSMCYKQCCSFHFDSLFYTTRQKVVCL